LLLPLQRRKQQKNPWLEPTSNEVTSRPAMVEKDHKSLVFKVIPYGSKGITRNRFTLIQLWRIIIL